MDRGVPPAVAWPGGMRRAVTDGRIGRPCGGRRRKIDTMRMRTSIALCVLGAWLSAVPAAVGSSRSAGSASAVIRALRAPRRRPPRRPRSTARPPQAAGAHPAARGVAAAAAVHPPRVPHAGQRLGHRAPDVPLLHPDPAEPAERRRVGAVRRGGREDRARGLQAAVGHQLPRQPLDRGARRPVRQRRDGQGSASSTWRSASASRSSTTRDPRRSSSRRSRRSSAKRASRSGSTRSSTRPSSAASRGSSAACSPRRATSSPRVTHSISEVAGGPKLVNLTFNLDEGPRVKVEEGRLHRQQGGLATASSKAR